jgi:hypothetical protein
VWLSWIRGLLGFVVGIEIIAGSWVLSIFIDDLRRNLELVPAGLIPVLNFLLVTSFLGIAAAILLFIGMWIRLMEPVPRPRMRPYIYEGAATVPLLECPECGLRGTSRHCPEDGAKLVIRES